MNKKIIVIGVSCFAIVGIVIWFCVTTKIKHRYEDYVEPDMSPYSYMDGDTFYLANSESDEETMVATAFASRGLVGGLARTSVDSYIDVDPPAIVQKYNVDYWYTIRTVNGVFNAVVVDGEVIIE